MSPRTKESAPENGPGDRREAGPAGPANGAAQTTPEPGSPGAGWRGGSVAVRSVKDGMNAETSGEKKATRVPVAGEDAGSAASAPGPAGGAVDGGDEVREPAGDTDERIVALRRFSALGRRWRAAQLGLCAASLAVPSPRARWPSAPYATAAARFRSPPPPVVSPPSCSPVVISTPASAPCRPICVYSRGITAVGRRWASRTSSRPAPTATRPLSAGAARPGPVAEAASRRRRRARRPGRPGRGPTTSPAPSGTRTWHSPRTRTASAPCPPGSTRWSNSAATPTRHGPRTSPTPGAPASPSSPATPTSTNCGATSGQPAAPSSRPSPRPPPAATSPTWPQRWDNWPGTRATTRVPSPTTPAPSPPTTPTSRHSRAVPVPSPPRVTPRARSAVWNWSSTAIPFPNRSWNSASCTKPAASRATGTRPAPSTPWSTRGCRWPAPTASTPTSTPLSPPPTTATAGPR